LILIRPEPKFEGTLTNYLITLPTGDAFKRFVNFDIALILGIDYRNRKRAFLEGLGKLLFRNPQCFLNLLTFRDVHRQTYHPFGFAVLLVLESPSGNDPA